MLYEEMEEACELGSRRNEVYPRRPHSPIDSLTVAMADLFLLLSTIRYAATEG